jgi:hypothetical protein
LLVIAGCSKHADSRVPQGGTGPNDGGDAMGPGSGKPPGLPSVHGKPDTSVRTALPPVPAMTNVNATVVGDSVSITFDPIGEARDYRVYVLPRDSDVKAGDGGVVTVQNAIYRCAGDRQAPKTAMDSEPLPQSGSVKTLVDGQDVHGFTRHLADANLGYVYVTPGPGRVPVYALGLSGSDADNLCYFQRWKESRAKTYTTSASERQSLLAKKYRDDGIAFYVPDTASDQTHTVYTATGDGGHEIFYFVDGPEKGVRDNPNPAFQVLNTATDDTQPLLRVYYTNACGKEHDELVAGEARFERARRQGDQVPMFDLEWSGITQSTTLVVEALDSGCPFQGVLGPVSEPEWTDSNGIDHPPWMTLSDLQSASPTGEVFINGQHEATNVPKAIARSFVKVTPGPAPDLDWFEGFGDDSLLQGLTDTDCGATGDNACWQHFRQTSDKVDLSFILVETERHAYAPFLGELWVMYDDVGADVNGKFRLTPKPKATISADKFLHVTMEVDSFTTGRRYPQILISDQDVPVQENLPNGNTLIVQTFRDWPYTYHVEVCDHRTWDVNNQCPEFDLYQLRDPNDQNNVVNIAPNAEVGEHAGVDRSTTFDVYASSKRIYLFLDGEPYGCADLPASGVPSGPVTVTFGDVLYHSGVDNLFTYELNHSKIETRRHFDNLGFKSGVDAPSWDSNRFPCVGKMLQ